MTIGVLELHLHTPWINTLQEKRLLVKHIIERVQHRFAASGSEIGDFQELHKLTLGFACVAGYPGMEHTVLDRIYQYIKENTDAEFIDVLRQSFDTHAS